MAICAVAGPLSNILLATLFAALYKVLMVCMPLLSLSNQTAANMIMFAEILLYLGIRMNITLAVFNLLPIPPLDGSKILYMFLPPHLYYKILNYERYIYFALLLLLATGVLTPVLSFVSNWIMRLLFMLFAI